MGRKEIIHYVIYDHPKDHPHFFVVRKWYIGSESIRAGPMALANTLEEARTKVPDGLTCIPRQERDDPVIVEVWM